MSSTEELLSYDVRVRERNLRKGILTPDQVASYVAALPDATTLADNVSVPQPAVPISSFRSPIEQDSTDSQVSAPSEDNA